MAYVTPATSHRYTKVQENSYILLFLALLQILQATSEICLKCLNMGWSDFYFVEHFSLTRIEALLPILYIAKFVGNIFKNSQ